MQRIALSLLIFIFLFIGSSSAGTLVSFESSFPEAWNNGNNPSPTTGVMKIPDGPGILTITTIQEPFFRAGLADGPTQVQYQNSQTPGLGTDIGMYLGETLFQKGADIGSIKRVSEDIPLNRVTRYFTCLDTGKSVSVHLLPAIVENSEYQLANKVSYQAKWEPLNGGRATRPGCDISGVWKTSKGNLTLSEMGYSLRYVSIDGSYTGKLKGTLQGTMSGPALTGIWSEPTTSGLKSGRFALFFSNDCCTFSGTWGTAESDTDGGVWTGVRT